MSQSTHRRPSTIGATSIAATQLQPDATSSAPRIWLFSVRESDEYDRLMFQGMADQCLRPHLHVPGVADVLEHAAEIVANTEAGAALRREWGARKVRHGKRDVGWLVFREANAFFLAMESAATINDTGENSHTEALANLVRELRPERHITGPFTRIVRNEHVAGRIAQAYDDVRCALHCAEVPSGLEVWNDAGRMLWSVLVQMASFEHRAIVRRMLAGTLYRCKLGLWPKAEEHLPLGFRFAPTAPGTPTGKVEPDPAQRAAVRRMIQLGATAHTNTEIARILGNEYGLSSAKLQRYHGDDNITIANARDPHTAMRMRYKHLLVYLTGDYPFLQSCPERGATHMFGVDVHLRADSAGDPISGSEHFVFDIPFGGGPQYWGVTEKEIRDAYAKRVLGTKAGPRVHGGGRGAEKLKPLASLCDYDDAEHDVSYRLAAHKKAMYRLLARPLSASVNTETGRRNGWDEEDAAVRYVAGLRSSEFHAAIADAITGALDSGVHGELRSLPVSRSQEGRQDELRARLHDLRASQAEELENAEGFDLLAAKAMADSRPEDASRHEARAAKAREHAARLLRRIEDLETELNGGGPVPKGTRGQFGDVARVVAYLRDCEDQAPAEVNAALQQIVSDFRVAKVSLLSVDFALHLSVPTSAGPVQLGPITVSVANRAKTSGGGGAGMESRAREFAAEFLLEGRPTAAIADDYGWDRVVVERKAREWLGRVGADGRPRVPEKGLRAALMDCPIPELRRALGAHIFGSSVSDADPAWAKHVVDIYTSRELRWSMAWAGDDHHARRAAVAVVRAVDSGAGVPIAVLAAALGQPEERLQEMSRPFSRRDAHTPAYGPCLQRVGGGEWSRWTAESEKLVTLITCPHCGAPVDHVLRVPEVTDAVLCRSCRRMPSDALLVFPEAYLRDWVGPRGAGTPRQEARGGTIVGVPPDVAAAITRARAQMARLR